MGNARSGFASMSKAQRRKMSAKGGRSQGKQNNPGNFANDPKRAASAGRKGGRMQGAHNNPANFANNPEMASEAGRKGGSARKR